VAEHHGIESLGQLNDLFAAWAEHVANRRVHAETGQSPIDRFQASGPRRQADAALIREAFGWSVTTRVTRTATVPLEGNSYAVDPALTGRRVELRYDPEDLTAIDVWLDGKPAGRAVPFAIGRHVHRAVPQAARPEPAPTGIDYLGLPARIAEITGRTDDHLGLALPELADPGPDWTAWRHQPQPLCPRCDARHDGGPVTRLLPHHRYVCTRHWYWTGPPDAGQPPRSAPSSPTSSRPSAATCAWSAATAPPPPTTPCSPDS
jgi:putative transposase